MGSEGCCFSHLVLARQERYAPQHLPVLVCLDGDLLPSAMRTNRCSHLPGVSPECPRPPAPDGKSLPSSSGGLATSCPPQYVMQVSSKDGQLLSSVVRTLAVQRYVWGRGRDGLIHLVKPPSQHHSHHAVQCVTLPKHCPSWSSEQPDKLLLAPVLQLLSLPK